MEDVEVKSPSVKSAVNFFNSLSKSSSIQVVCHQQIRVSPLIPRPKLIIKRNGDLTPDVEAKNIIEEFNKKISPYNTFKLPVDALHSDFFKQNFEPLLPDVVAPEKKRRRNRIYRKPAKSVSFVKCDKMKITKYTSLLLQTVAYRNSFSPCE
ncbi:hypothetical protein TcasGA2_TC007757 [Tribolium castaneum]|uniref:Uncharacterized protein n=1 Tax=Tribolium castaneum TaxID=7070 RepID=D2A1H1_TRICA|nr:hypothetical protein TcasGA2_TC007757 [Tribolium castaneum]